jgi:hypothetical protein
MSTCPRCLLYSTAEYFTVLCLLTWPVLVQSIPSPFPSLHQNPPRTFPRQCPMPGVKKNTERCAPTHGLCAKVNLTLPVAAKISSSWHGQIRSRTEPPSPLSLACSVFAASTPCNHHHHRRQKYLFGQLCITSTDAHDKGFLVVVHSSPRTAGKLVSQQARQGQNHPTTSHPPPS